MEYSKKFRWAMAGLITMVILNIGTVATIWMILPPSRAVVPDDDPPRRVQRFLERELDLTRQQLDDLRELRREHFQEIRLLTNEIRQSRNAYFDLLKTADSAVDSARRDSLANQIGRHHVRLEKANYDHFMKLRGLLSNEQKVQFDRIINQTIRMREEVIWVGARDLECGDPEVGCFDRYVKRQSELFCFQGR